MTQEEKENVFWSKVNKLGPYPDRRKYPKLKTRCWLWIGAFHTDGYGTYKMLGESLAHRIAWLLADKLITKKKPNILHRCDTPACIRHLFAGTQQDNIRDRNSKGRQSKGISHSLSIPYCKGELAGRAQLTNKQALKIRKMYTTGLYTQRSLASLFSVKSEVVGRIVRKYSYSEE